MHEREQANAAHGRGEVQEELAKPLLVDPRLTVCRDGQSLVPGKPVLGDVPAACDCKPGVLDELHCECKTEGDPVDRERRDRLGIATSPG